MFPSWKNKISQYAWNSSTNYDIDVTRCIADVVRELRFSLDVNIGASTTLEYD